jgi:hypothetical protein
VLGLAVSAHHRVRLSETSSRPLGGLLDQCVSVAADLVQSALRSARAVLLLLPWLLVDLLHLCIISSVNVVLVNYLSVAVLALSVMLCVYQLEQG